VHSWSVVNVYVGDREWKRQSHLARRLKELTAAPGTCLCITAGDNDDISDNDEATIPSMHLTW